MIQDDFVFFLPTRKGSERVKNKNTRTFANIEGGILAIKIQQLLNVKRINKIIISTNDPLTIEIAESFKNSKIRIILRPDYLCLSSTVLDDFIKYIPTVIDAHNIFWVHTTSPFANEQVYNLAIDTYIDKVLVKREYDSMLSVTKIQNFLWSKREKQGVNFDRNVIKWPRTQDLEPLYEINSAFFINSIESYFTYNDRIGKNPYLFELNKIQSFDIDWEDDFELAEYIYKSLNKVDE
ncbi:N-acylneuraminate cytidylyltransferase [termite gut metagenome]|uniref:N-acylneuraminate cytidylyltransferase n=1 Tax=termite gut metagenome TaxID=433724 RepID=A0A5J4R003_9ZZZZ